jgi:hypothetical protein
MSWAAQIRPGVKTSWAALTLVVMRTSWAALTRLGVKTSWAALTLAVMRMSLVARIPASGIAPHEGEHAGGRVQILFDDDAEQARPNTGTEGGLLP